MNDEVMNNDDDIILFSDDEGNEISGRILDYFFYNGQEYALLTEDIDDLDSRAPDEEVEVFICQVAQIDDELEEFIPVDDELMEPLLKIAMTRFEALEDEDD